MRGNPFSWKPRRNRVGSIPAYAGEPHLDTVRRGGSGVYPRVCGGTAGAGERDGLVEGLSPRMRGNLVTRSDTHLKFRSIPAYAGEPAPKIAQYI